jgi:hypothetical protein
MELLNGTGSEFAEVAYLAGPNFESQIRRACNGLYTAASRSKYGDRAPSARA